MGTLAGSVARWFGSSLVVSVMAGAGVAQSYLGTGLFTGANPLDIELTPNATRAVVRGFTPGSFAGAHFATVWDPNAAPQLPLLAGPASPTTSFGFAIPVAGYPQYPQFYGPSDFVAVTNDRAVVIGSADDVPIPTATQETYIVVIDIASATPQVVASYALSVAASQATVATIHGHAHDVAITPDGTYAVVNELNWAHVVRLSDGALSSFQLSASDGIQRFPGTSVDSVEATNSRAVVLSSLQTNGNPPRADAWVFILDLTSWPPTMALVHDLSAEFALPTESYDPHDVKITPDGSLAIVTANAAARAYDLAASPPVPSTYTEDYSRFYPGSGAYGQIDSVECNDNYALTIHYQQPPQTGSCQRF